MLYFLTGRLPWHGLRADSKQLKYQLILDRKVSISLDELCSDVPYEFTKTWAMSGLWALATSQIIPGSDAYSVICLFAVGLITTMSSTGLS